MATNVVGVGSAANDGNGDDLRTAFTALNVMLQKADATSAAQLILHEDTTGGTNKHTFTSGTTNLAADRTITLPDNDVDLDVINTIQTTNNGEGASLIGVEDAATNFTGATVEACLTELGALFTTANGEGASLVGIEDAGTLITATDVEGALAENRALIDTNTTKTAIITMASASGATSIDLAEDTDNGSGYVRVIGPAAVTGASRTFTLPDADVTVQTDILDKTTSITAAVAGTGTKFAYAEPTGGGSSTCTVVAPALSGNRTVTLPDADLNLGAVITANTDGQMWVGVDQMLAISGTWTPSVASNVLGSARTAAGASHEVIFPINLPARTGSSKGRSITSVEFIYSIDTEVADDCVATLIKTTANGDGSIPTAASVAVTYDAAHDSAAERGDNTGAPEQHTQVLTVDSPAYIGSDEAYHIHVTVDDTTGGGADVTLYGCLVKYTELLVDAS